MMEDRLKGGSFSCRASCKKEYTKEELREKKRDMLKSARSNASTH